MTKLESGNTYKITDLFRDDRHIIIPDLQRDYCWGDKKHGDNNNDLVTAFLENLSEIFKENRDIKLGMIYAYEYPINSNRIYLCDGQQRITTLFLLLGMINKRVTNTEVTNCLISELELTDDQEPRLLYAIRESTLYFLSDLVCNFFLENTETKISEVKKQSWYFKEYDLDPTIQSMISAMEIIEKEIDHYDNLDGFADFILHKIKFFYFDMKNREAGEDMFVVINTTGEPLTATENTKPLLIGNILNEEERANASNIWEKWEKWFWENRSEKEHDADNGLNKFFIFYWQIKLLQEKQWKQKKSFEINPFQLFSQTSEIESNEESSLSLKQDELVKIKSIDEIDKYFVAYQNLFEDFKIEANQKILNSIKSIDFKSAYSLREIPLNIILPLIEFKIKYPKELIYDFLRRLRKNHFDGHKDWNKRIENYVDWRHLIQLVYKSTSMESLFLFSNDSNFKVISNVPNNIKNWFNLEEQLKRELKKENIELIERIEDHQDFMGRISFFLFEVHKLETKINCLDLDKYFCNYTDAIDNIRNNNDSNPNLMNYTRLLLMINNCNQVGDIKYTSGHFKGVLFSTIENRFHLLKTDFKEFCSLENDNLIKINFCKKRISTKITNDDIFNENIFSIENFIKSWLILKVVNAENENSSLSFYDANNTGVCAYIDPIENKILSDEEFSLGNSLCGFGVRRGFGSSGNYVHYTPKEHWLKPYAIDTPFAEIAFEPNKRTKEQIDRNFEKINELKKITYNW